MSEPGAGRVWVGTANWSDHTGFYPRGTKAGERLAYYASRLRGGGSERQLLSAYRTRSMRSGPEQTPEAFRFLVKAHRAVANRPRDSVLAAEYIKNQYEGVQPLREAGKFGGFLVQLGANVRPSDPRRTSTWPHCGMDWVTTRLRLNSGTRAGWRVRRGAETVERLRALGMAMVIPDEPRAAAAGLPEPVRRTDGAERCLLPLHGTRRCR